MPSALKATNRMGRSCHRCSQKKIRCSKSCPCESCSRSGSECVFPGPGRAPRHKLRPLKGELVSQTQNLTEQVQELTRQLQALTKARSDLPNAGVCPVHAERGEHGTLLVDEEAPRYVSHQVLVNLGAQASFLFLFLFLFLSFFLCSSLLFFSFSAFLFFGEFKKRGLWTYMLTTSKGGRA